MADMDEILKGDQPRDEHGRFASAEAPTDAPPASPPVEIAPPVETETLAPAAIAAPAPAPVTAPDHVPMAALHDERRKRQALERRLAEFEQKSTPTPAPELPADFFENPQGHLQSVEERAVQRALSQASEQMRNQFANLCEIAARGRYNDYDTVVEAFLSRVQDDPVLRAELSRAADPADFAYKTGKRLKEFAEVGDLTSYRQKLETEIRAKLEAEYRAKQGASVSAAVPQSLNAETSAPAAGVPSGRTPLESIIKNHL